MRKCTLFLSLFFLLFCGCSHQNKMFRIEGIIENNEHELISIHYPKTGIQILDSKIEQEVREVRESFQEYVSDTLSLQETPELNIDYKYKMVGKRYINIALFVFYTAPTLAHPVDIVKTFVFDSYENRFLLLSDIIKLNIFDIKKDLVKQYASCIDLNGLDEAFSNLDDISFTFTNKSITLYFNPYEIASHNCGIIKYEIPVSNFLIPLEESSISNTFEYHPSYKNLSISKPTIAFTFDDGPSQYTKDIVSLLNEYDSNATFFILGNKVENYHDTLTYVLESGNELGNHSYNHKKLTRLSSLELHQQIDLTNQLVKKTLGYDIRLLRPTYGSISKSLRKEINMDIVLWNIDTLDWKIRNGKKIASKALEEIEDGKIVLMHDIYSTTLDALKIMLPELKKQGYQIVTVSELKEIEKKRNEKS